MRTRWALGTLVGCVVAWGGCGGEPTSTLVVRVVEEPLGPGEAGRGIAGARVAFDPPRGGARIERTSDAEGRVTFEADRAGVARVSAVSAEHTLVTRLDVAPDAPELTLALPRLDAVIPADTVAVGGRITNKVRPSDRVDVSVSGIGRLGRTETDDGAYALRRRPGLPGTLFVHVREVPDETNGVLVAPHVKSFVVALPPRDADEVLDLDVGAAAPRAVSAMRLRAEVPSAFGPGTRCVAAVGATSSRAALGVVTRAGVLTDGACEVELAVLDGSVMQEPFATRVSLVAPGGARSVRTEVGVVPNETAVADFLAPIMVPEASRSLKDAIPLDGYPEGAELRAEVYAAGQLVWVVTGPAGRAPDGGVLRLPPPLGLDFSTDVQLLAVSITVRDGKLPEAMGAFRREATSADVILRRR